MTLSSAEALTLIFIYVSSPSGVDIVAFSDQTVYQAMLPYQQGVIYGYYVSYSEDTDTLLDGGGLLHELGNAGHDGGAVVAGPVSEEAGALLAKTKLLTSVTSSDESGVEAVGHVRPPGGKTLRKRIEA